MTSKKTIVKDPNAHVFNGVELHVTPEDLDDFELIGDLYDLRHDIPDAIYGVFKKIAGDKAQALLDTIRDEKGKVTSTAAGELLTEIFTAVAPN